MTSPISALIPTNFSGVVHVTRDDVVLHSQAYGFADRANQRPNRVDTRFGTASAGKALVAVGIMRLVADGQLKLNATIGDLLTLDLRAIDPTITVRQLLNHTSGIPDYFDESVMDEYADLFVDFPNYRIRTSTDIVPLFIDKPMTTTPGEVFAYNNTGYVVLGLVIEAVTGLPFDKYLQAAVFDPAGMALSGYFELDRLPGNCANAYLEDGATNIYSVDAKGTGAGGAFLTADDVVRFWDALTSGVLLPADLVREMHTTQASEIADDGDITRYGYGFWLGGDTGEVPAFMGEDPGVAFMTSRGTDRLTTVVVSNQGDDVWEIHSAIREALSDD